MGERQRQTMNVTKTENAEVIWGKTETETETETDNERHRD